MPASRAVRLVVFDLDGTLVDSARDLATAVNDALKEVAPGTEPLPLDVVRGFVGNGAATLVERALAHASVSAPTERVLPILLACYRRRMLETTRLYPGVSDALDALADRALAVLTNKPGDPSREILVGLGVAERFRRIWGPDDAGARKPDPAGLLRLVSDLGFAPEDAVMVGDSSIDIATGRAAGVLTVGVTYGFDPSSLTVVPPDLTVDNLSDLPAMIGPSVSP